MRRHMHIGSKLKLSRVAVGMLALLVAVQVLPPFFGFDSPFGLARGLQVQNDPTACEAVGNNWTNCQDGFTSNNVYAYANDTAGGGSSGLDVEKGSFTRQAGTGNQAVTGVGFTPKVVIFWGTLATTEGFSSDTDMFWGWAVSTAERYSLATSGLDANTTGGTKTRFVNDRAITIITGLTPTISGEADFVSFEADGFTVNWITNDGTQNIIHYMAIGGDDLTNVKAGDFTAPIVTGNNAVTGVGFQPKFLLFMTEGKATAFPGTTGKAVNFGWAISSTERGTIGQLMAGKVTKTDEAGGFQRTNETLVQVKKASQIEAAADFVSMDADGFTLDWNIIKNANLITYLAFAGADLNVDVGALNQPTSPGAQAITGLGFSPDGIYLSSWNKVASGSGSTPAQLSTGGASGATSEGGIWGGGLDNPPTDTKQDSYTSTGAIITLADPGTTPTITAQADLQSFDSDGFTLDWTTADATARQVLYWAIGGTGGGNGGGPGKNDTAWKDFGFALGASDTVTSVEVGVEWFRNNTAPILNVSISWDGGTTWATNQTATNKSADDDTVEFLDFTSATAWTATKLNDANLRVRVGTNASGARLDHVTVRVNSNVAPLISNFRIQETGSVQTQRDPTACQAFGNNWTNCPDAFSSNDVYAYANDSASGGGGNDFKIQRGRSTIATSATTVTITAGTEYTAPAALANAFIRIVGNRKTSPGNDVGDVNTPVDKFMTSIQNPGNLLTSITFERYTSDATWNAVIFWEIIEYIGASGGANEMVVLDQAEIEQTSGTQQSGSAIAPTTDADVVVFVTGQRSAGTSQGDGDRGAYTSEWLAGTNVPEFTRGDGTGTASVSYTVVEFTGSNWIIQRAEHTYVASAGEETETINAVVLARTFTHNMMRATIANINDWGNRVRLASTTTVGFELQINADIGSVAVAWVIENTQTDGTPMAVQAISGTQGPPQSEPDEWTETITAVADLATTSVMGESGYADSQGNAAPRGVLGLEMNSTTTVTLWRGDSLSNSDYRFDVVEWPTVAGGGGGPGKNDTAWRDFGFGLSGSITQVEVGVEWFRNNTAPILNVSISWDGGTTWATNQTATNKSADDDAVEFLDFTAATAWTAAKLNDANLRVRVGTNASGARLDYLSVRTTVLPSRAGTQLDVNTYYDYLFNVTDADGWSDIASDGNVSLRLWYDGNGTPTTDQRDPTACEAVGNNWTNCQDAFSSGDVYTYANDSASGGGGNDFKIQRGQSTIPTSAATVTITAGTNYTAPASLSKSFIRIVGTRLSGNGQDAGTQNYAETRIWTVSISDPGNLLTSITFQRYLADATFNTRVYWEVIEYTGSGGGANEFIVRDQAEIEQASGTQQNGSSVAPTTDADVVVFITGQRGNGSNSGLSDRALYTAEWVAATNVPRFTRGDGTGNASVSYAVVEFTGSNWKVQRAEHTYSASGVEETETITAVNSVSRTFLHVQMRTASGNIDEMGQRVRLASTTTVGFQLRSGAGIFSQVGVAWVVENTQTDGTPMNVQRVSGTRSGGGAEPDEWTETITAVADLATTSIMAETSDSSGTGNSAPRGAIGLNLTATTTVTLWRFDTGNTQDYRFEVVEWPTAPGGGGGPGNNDTAWKDFGFALSGSITQVEVGVEWFRNNTAPILNVSISWDGGTTWATNQTATNKSADDDTVEFLDFTSATAWTAAKLNDANLRVRVGTNASGPRLDYVTVRVESSSGELTFGEQTTGANYRIVLTYQDTADPTTASLSEWSVTEGRATYNASASSLTAITDGYEFKLALTFGFQVKHAVAPTNSTVGAYNDLDSWNAEIVATDGLHNTTLQEASTGEHMEFGVFKYTFVNISADWTVTLEPGQTANTGTVTVYRRSNDDFTLRIWFVTDLVKGGDTIPIINVQILAAGDPADNITVDTAFAGLGDGNAVYILGSATLWFNHSTDTDEDTTFVQFSVTVPGGQALGLYTAQLTIRIQQRP